MLLEGGRAMGQQVVPSSWLERLRVYSASGANGQVMTIHHPSNSVIVGLSSFPDWLGDRMFDHLWAGQMAVATALQE